MRIKIWFRYFFPRRTIRQRLPLPPKHYTSRHNVWGEPPPEMKEDIDALIWRGLAATRADAYRVLRKHKGKPLRDIIKLETRKRSVPKRWKYAWRRFKKVW